MMQGGIASVLQEHEGVWEKIQRRGTVELGGLRYARLPEQGAPVSNHSPQLQPTGRPCSYCTKTRRPD